MKIKCKEDIILKKIQFLKKNQAEIKLVIKNSVSSEMENKSIESLTHRINQMGKKGYQELKAAEEFDYLVKDSVKPKQTNKISHPGKEDAGSLVNH